MRRGLVLLLFLICLAVAVFLVTTQWPRVPTQAPPPHATLPVPAAISEAIAEAKSRVQGGIGAALTLGNTGSNGLPCINSVIPGSPAAAAGLQAGDAILQLNGQPVAGLPLAEVVERVRGFHGTSVQLAILRGESTNPILMTIHRASFHSLGIKPNSQPLP
jgi:carboxyl-terminal processing protease